MYCPSCGASNAEYGASCASCGRPLPGTRPAPGRRAPFGARWLVVTVFAAAMVLTIALARVAIPSYLEYTIREQVAEGVELANAHKVAIVAAWKSAGHDFSNISSGSVGRKLERHGKYVESVDVVSGAIVVTYGGEAHARLRGRTLTIVPALDAEARSVEWQCGRGTAPAGFEPIFGEPARLTDVPDEYLSASCRSR